MSPGKLSLNKTSPGKLGKVFIAGGAGFIGSRLAIALAKSQVGEVIAFDNLTRRGSELNLAKLVDAGVRFVHGDIRCTEDLDAVGLESSTLIDCAAEPSVLAGYSASQRVIQNNLMGTINLLEKAKVWQARFVFISTSRVYPINALCNLKLIEQSDRFDLESLQSTVGVTQAGISEEFPLHGHRSLYGATKLAGELMVEEFRQAYGLATVINRCGVVAGPGQMARADQGVFALWVAAHLLKKPLKYIGFGGRGSQVRDLLHVDDLVELIQLQLSQFGSVDGQVFNVGGGVSQSLSLKQTSDICQELTGNKLSIEADSQDRPGDIPWFITDSRRVKTLLNWQPQRSAACTLEDILAWIRSDQTALTRIFAS